MSPLLSFFSLFGTTMLFLIALLMVLCAAAAENFELDNAQNQLFGKERCDQGPTYWCSNLMNAKECNSVKHCIRTVWKHQILTDDNGDICKTCKDMIARLDGNEMQEELKENFKGSCKLIPVKNAVNECERYIDEFILELVEVLSSEMNPQMVCSVASLCNNARNDRHLAEKKEVQVYDLSTQGLVSADINAGEEIPCELCEKLLIYFRNIPIANRTEDKFKEVLDIICSHAGSHKSDCLGVVKEYSDMQFVLISNPKGGCEAMHICKGSPQIEDLNFPTVRVERGIIKSITCWICNFILDRVRGHFGIIPTAEQMGFYMRKNCRYLPTAVGKCIKYADIIIKLLTEFVHPKSVCDALNVCNKVMTDHEEGLK